MDPKYVRKTIESLLAELERNPAIGRRRSPSFMSRYGRPLGLGIALGVSGAAGCGDSSGESKDNPDALPAAKDALDAPRDVYGISMPDGPADSKDAFVRPADTRDALTYAADAYGITSDVSLDSRDALPLKYDVYVRPFDGGPVDLYGISSDTLRDSQPDRPIDTQDASDAQPDSGDAGPDATDSD